MNAPHAEHLHNEQQTVATNPHRESYTDRSLREIAEAAAAAGMDTCAWMEAKLRENGGDWLRAKLNTGVGNYLLWRDAWLRMRRPIIARILAGGE